MKKRFLTYGLSKRAFTVVNLVITVGIIALLGAISLNIFHRVRLEVNDKIAAVNIATVQNAMIFYRKVNSSYPENFTVLREGQPPYLSEGTFLQPVSSTSNKRAESKGYSYVMLDPPTENAATSYRVTAIPIERDVTGSKYYLADTSGAREVSIDEIYTLALNDVELSGLINAQCREGECGSGTTGGSGGGSSGGGGSIIVGIKKLK